MYKTITGIFLIILFATSCMNDDILDGGLMTLPLDKINKHRGLFIINEGTFRWDNSSLSYYDIDDDTIYNDIFNGVNGLVLGDVAQSMSIKGKYGYIVVNNSSKIYVIDINTFKCIGKITGLISPRYMHFINDEKAYVSDLYAKAITIINPSEMNVIGVIPTDNNCADFYQHSTEQMIQIGQYLYTNCWSYDNKVLVIDTMTDSLIDSIIVIKQPTSMVMDVNENIWVASDGGYLDSPYGQVNPGIACIKTKDRSVIKKYQYDMHLACSEITVNGGKDTIYFLNKHCYRKCVNDDKAPEIFINWNDVCENEGSFYGLTVDPFTSEIYLINAHNFASRGTIYRFDNTGKLKSTFKAGITPGSFTWK